MCSITDLDNASAGRCPLWLGIAPEKFEVDNRVGWSHFNELLEDGCPLVLLHAGHFIHTSKDFFLVDRVVPAFLFRTSDLDMSANMNGEEE